MAKFKIDSKRLKEIVTTRYEIVALVAAGALVVLFVLLGFSKWVSASSPYQAIEKDEQKLSQLRSGGGGGKTGDSKDAKIPPGWTALRPGQDYKPLDEWAYFESGAAGTAQRRDKPIILALDGGQRAVQVNYLHRPVLAYDVNLQAGKLNVTKGNTGEKDKALDPYFLVPAKRLVVVSASFPYLKQCEEFRKALRLDAVEDLFRLGLQPTFEGLIVERCEVTTGDDAKENWQKLYWADKDGKPATTDAIKEMLRTTQLDSANAEKYADVIYGQTVTPLPLLVGTGTDSQYPDIKIAEFDKRPSPAPGGGGFLQPPPKGEPGMPGGPAGGRPIGQPRYQATWQARASDPGAEPKGADIASLPEDLKNQFSGNMNWFDPHGQFPKEPDATDKDATSGEQPPKEKGVRPEGPPPFKGKGPRPEMPPPGPGGYPYPGGEKANLKAPSAPPKFGSALVRFVDVDVEPGKVYKYRIKLRLANPNFGLPTKIVLNSEYSRDREFETPGWLVTDAVAIPQEYFFYVINQEKGFHSKAAGKRAIDRETGVNTHDRVAFQIHKWVDEAENKRQVSDWVVCERLLVARGDALGRFGKPALDKDKDGDKVEVELVAWSKGKSNFELTTGAGPKPPKDMVNGVPIDFTPRMPIYLLDFVGNKQNYKFAKGPSIDDDSACEALVLMPDGTMIVCNTRNDMNDGWTGKERPEFPQGNPRGMERRDRLEFWAKRLKDFRDAATTDPKTPPLKGGGKDGN
jgi:hypothetical protein